MSLSFISCSSVSPRPAVSVRRNSSESWVGKFVAVVSKGDSNNLPATLWRVTKEHATRGTKTVDLEEVPLPGSVAVDEATSVVADSSSSPLAKILKVPVDRCKPVDLSNLNLEI